MILTSHINCIVDLDAIDREYCRKVTGAYAESTAKNLASQWTNFIDFYGAHHLPLYPPCPLNVARYLTSYSAKVGAYGTLCNALSAISKFYELSGFKLDTQSPVIDLLLKSCKRHMSSVSKPKSPIQVPHILLIKNIVNFNDPAEHAFFVALVIQFFSTIRISNLLPVSVNSLNSIKHLRRSDIVFVDNCIILTLPWSKTLQNADNIFTIPIVSNPGSVLDPVYIYSQFITNHPVPPKFSAFSYQIAGVPHVITQSMYQQYLKSFLSKLGIDSSSFSSHSVRRGSASFMFESSVPNHLLKAHGTWRSNAYTRYLSFNFKQKCVPTVKMNEKINQMFGHMAL